MGDQGGLDETGRPITQVSWTRLKTWESCHQASHLRSQGRSASIRDGRNFLIGNLADRALRNFLAQDDGTHAAGQLAAHVDALWDYWALNGGDDGDVIKWRGNPREDQERVRELAKRCVTNLETFLFRRVLPLEYQGAVRFRVPLQLPDLRGGRRTVALIGEVDVVTRDPATGRWYLYDLKATEREDYASGATLGQLIFYPLAWSIRQAVPASTVDAAFLTPLTKTQYHQLTVRPEELRAMLGRVLAYVHAVWRDEPDDWAPATDDAPCFHCDVKHACPNYQAPVNVTETGRHKVDLNALAGVRRAAKVGRPTPAGQMPDPGTVLT